VTDWWQASKKWASWLEGQATLPDKRSRMKLVGALGLAAAMLVGLVAVGSLVAPKAAHRHHAASGAQVPLFSPTAPSTTVPSTVAVPTTTAPKTTAAPKSVAAPNPGGSTTAVAAAVRGTLTASTKGHTYGQGRKGRARRRPARLHRRAHHAPPGVGLRGKL